MRAVIYMRVSGQFQSIRALWIMSSLLSEAIIRWKQRKDCYINDISK